MPRRDVYGYRACPDCGSAVQKKVLDNGEHVCNSERFIAHQSMLARRELDRFEDLVAAYVATPAGAFQQFLARRP